MCPRTSQDIPGHPGDKSNFPDVLYYTFMHLFYKAGVVLNYIEAFIAVSARSHNMNMSQKDSLPIVAEIKLSKLGRSPKKFGRTA